jgi:hypothetical protein
MTRWIVPAVVVLLLSATGTGSAQITVDEREALRTQLEQRFDIVPLSGAVGLRPREPMGDIRFIEVADTISINGVIVTGREVRERVTAEAEAILRLSYLDADARRQFLESATTPSPGVSPPPLRPDTGVEAPPRDDDPRAHARRRTRAGGDRVRIFGDVHVREGEVLDGQAVAVMGSVSVDGEVDDQVVAVMGSVLLGPNAVVRGDIVTVGGRVNRAPGAEVRGAITEVAIGGFSPSVWVPFPSVRPRWGGFWDGFGGVPRLIGTTFRLVLLALLAALALLLARPVVEAAAERLQEAPVHATLVGMFAILLLGPVLFLLSLVLVVSIIGLPLLIGIPFLLVALLLMALAGFSGTASAVGRWVRRRVNLGGASPFVDVCLGVVVILLPLLVARLIALGGWWGGTIAMPLVAVAVGVEFVAWSAGFGAVLTNTFSRWQARRASRSAPPPPPVPPPVPATVPPAPTA